MDTQPLAKGTLVRSVLDALLPHVPEPIRFAAMAALPGLCLQLERLGLEVLDAEQRGIDYSSAVRQPHFPMMATVYFGATDLLRWRLPRPVRDALRPILKLAEDGSFDATRQLWFTLARDRTGSEAAAGRFFLWCALVINLRFHTWDYPEAEAFGALSAIEEEAEVRLNELLDVPDIYEPGFRPLNVLVLGLLEETRWVTKDLWRLLLLDTGVGLKELLECAEALRHTRRMEARDAATLEPRLLEPTVGSQQTVDEHPLLYPTVQALESRRSRLLQKLGTSRYEIPDDRLIDLFRSTMSGVPK